MIRRRIAPAWLGIVVVIAALAAPALAEAQTKGNVSGGYSFLFDSDVNLPTGFLFSGTYNLHEMVGVTGELGRNFGDVFGFSTTVTTFMFGARFGSTDASEIRPFAQFLFGQSRTGILGESVGFSGFDLGGGVDVPVGRKVAVRIQFDQQTLKIGDTWAQQYRIAVGGVYMFGVK